ncbi:hypothetical protein FRC03_011049 [Tulasnella sp. 419]|nr:hypothetical protein FRC03_011049 [Tulasnella sp. 419]
MERTSTHIKVWFWAKNEDPTAIPEDIRLAKSTVYPGNWGKPFASFNSQGCNIAQKFGPNNIIINLTFCGDWAGNDYPSSCPQSCVDHVNYNPGAFKEAYWDIRGLRIYQPKAKSVCSNNQMVLGARDLDTL